MMEVIHIRTKALLDGIEYTIFEPTQSSGVISHKKFRAFLLKERVIREEADYLLVLKDRKLSHDNAVSYLLKEEI